MKSARDGNIDNVQYALDHGADINYSRVSNTLIASVCSIIVLPRLCVGKIRHLPCQNLSVCYLAVLMRGQGTVLGRMECVTVSLYVCKAQNNDFEVA